MHRQRGVLLLVDGELGRAERMAKRLAHLDMDIEVADNGAVALLKAHELHPEVVVAATNLPVLDGIRMLDALRSQAATRDIQVILITDGNKEEELVRGWTAGADLCIPRSQGEADILATLHRALPNAPRWDHQPHDLRMVS